MTCPDDLDEADDGELFTDDESYDLTHPTRPPIVDVIPDLAHYPETTTMSATTVTVTSFGYLHDTPPPAHITLDLRAHFRDPHVTPDLRHQTAHDEPVRHAVLGTPGIRQAIAATVSAALAYLAGPSAGPLSLAVGCAGGRHRAATVAAVITEVLAALGITVDLVHRDLHLPVIDR
ncbi:ATPase [Kitasatospora sp. NPDC057692]|uniref:RapZ C-terminal domain-containing protein n=1 Tax=Kitasatospora sp. NPDC057692 TaxID=3346215 RepID=UPI0036B021D8